MSEIPDNVFWISIGCHACGEWHRNGGTFVLVPRGEKDLPGIERSLGNFKTIIHATEKDEPLELKCQSCGAVLNVRLLRPGAWDTMHNPDPIYLLGARG